MLIMFDNLDYVLNNLLASLCRGVLPDQNIRWGIKILHQGLRRHECQFGEGCHTFCLNLLGEYSNPIWRVPKFN